MTTHPEARDDAVAAGAGACGHVGKVGDTAEHCERGRARTRTHPEARGDAVAVVSGAGGHVGKVGDAGERLVALLGDALKGGSDGTFWKLLPRGLKFVRAACTIASTRTPRSSNRAGARAFKGLPWDAGLVRCSHRCGRQ